MLAKHVRRTFLQSLAWKLSHISTGLKKVADCVLKITQLVGFEAETVTFPCKCNGMLN